MSFADTSHSYTGEYDRYLGIDPGLNRTGYAVLERRPTGPVLLEGGILRSDAKSTLQARVLEIARGLREVLEELERTLDRPPARQRDFQPLVEQHAESRERRSQLARRRLQSDGSGFHR